MGIKQIGFGSHRAESAELEAETWTHTTSTVIECKLCETKFYYHDLMNDENLNINCECKNLTIKPTPATAAKFKSFIGVYHDEQYPHIYEISYEDYLKTQE